MKSSKYGKISAANQSVVLDALERLRNTKNRSEFDAMWSVIKANWLSVPERAPYAIYIDDEWISSDNCNWAIWCSPWSDTNNGIESFNSRLKGLWTERVLLAMVSAMEVFAKCIAFHANRLKDFQTETKATSDTITAAKALLDTPNRAAKLRRVVPEAESISFTYDASQEGIFRIDSIARTCTCMDFMKMHMCLHLHLYKSS